MLFSSEYDGCQLESFEMAATDVKVIGTIAVFLSYRQKVTDVAAAVPSEAQGHALSIYQTDWCLRYLPYLRYIQIADWESLGQTFVASVSCKDNSCVI